MNQEQVEALIHRLVKALQTGSQSARDIYSDLTRIYDAWASEKTDDNWRDVVSAAERSMDSISDEDQDGPSNAPIQ